LPTGFGEDCEARWRYPVCARSVKRLEVRFLTMGNRQNERKFAMVLFLLGLVVGVLAGLAVGVIVGTALAKNIWICG